MDKLRSTGLRPESLQLWDADAARGGNQCCMEAPQCPGPAESHCSGWNSVGTRGDTEEGVLITTGAPRAWPSPKRWKVSAPSISLILNPRLASLERSLVCSEQ